MKNGKFRDTADIDQSAYVEINGNLFFDYSNNGREFIKSKIVWLNDCSYELTLLESNIPDLGLEKGTKLRVNILSVNGNEIRYQYQSGEYVEPRTLIKIIDSDKMKNRPNSEVNY